MAQARDEKSTPHADDRRAALDAIRRQLLEKIRERYRVDADEAERRLRALEEED
ncbi:MAG: CsbD family protein [Gammaproteobacteria bacterium]